jgi:hypothetical protein
VIPGGLAVALVPIDLTPPTISGTAQQGQMLTCSNGTWLNSPTSYSYSWQRNATTIAGETTNQYTLTSADVSQLITCTVVAHNGSGDSLPAISVPVIPGPLPRPLVPVDVTAPTISGTAQQGHAVTCSNGTWLNSPTSYTYSWQRNATTIAGQTTNQYTLTSADVSQLITCTVVAHNGSGNSLPATSVPVSPGASTDTGGSRGSTTTTGKLPTPNIRSFSISPRRLIVLINGSHRRTKGTTFRFALDRTANVLIIIQRRTIGRLRGGRCVAAKRLPDRNRRCTIYKRIRLRVLHRSAAGSHRLKFSGRVGRRLIAPGTYRALIVAVNGGGWSRTRSASFKVIRRRGR